MSMCGVEEQPKGGKAPRVLFGDPLGLNTTGSINVSSLQATASRVISRSVHLFARSLFCSSVHSAIS